MGVAMAQWVYRADGSRAWMAAEGWVGDQIRTSGHEIAAGWIPGTPRGQPRGRHIRGRVVSWGAAARPVKLWRERVERELRTAAEAAGGSLSLADGAKAALGVSLRFVFATEDRGRWGKPHTSKPDADNLAKLWMDAAAKAGLLLGRDDAALAGVETVKLWGGIAGCGWTLRAMGGSVGELVSMDDLPEDVPWWWDRPE